MNTNYITQTGLFIDKDLLVNLKGFLTTFKNTGDTFKLGNMNDMNEVYVLFSFASFEAIIWLYRWIHLYMLNGDVDKNKDYEIQWMTGDSDFIYIVYKILYKAEFNKSAEIAQIKY